VERLVPRPECLGRVDPAGHGPRRSRSRGTAAPSPGSAARTGRPAIRRRVSGPRAAPTPCARAAVPCQVGVRLVDLGHQASSDPRGRGVVAGQVRMVLPCEPAPGGLDLGRGRSGLDPEDVMRVALRHVWMISAARRRDAGSRPPAGDTSRGCRHA
jgi:hypothetical protein